MAKEGFPVKSYLLKLSDREEGPYQEEQVSQLFADGLADRNTPCRVAPDGPWRTIDDVLPMLKYGTHLPNPTPAPVVRSEEPPVYGAGSIPPRLPRGNIPADVRVSVVDFDLPFGSILRLMFKWVAAALIVSLCFIPVFFLLFAIVMAIFGTLLGGLFSGLHSP